MLRGINADLSYNFTSSSLLGPEANGGNPASKWGQVMSVEAEGAQDSYLCQEHQESRAAAAAATAMPWGYSCCQRMGDTSGIPLKMASRASAHLPYP